MKFDMRGMILEVKYMKVESRTSDLTLLISNITYLTFCFLPLASCFLPLAFALCLLLLLLPFASSFNHPKNLIILSTKISNF